MPMVASCPSLAPEEPNFISMNILDGSRRARHTLRVIDAHKAGLRLLVRARKTSPARPHAAAYGQRPGHLLARGSAADLGCGGQQRPPFGRERQVRDVVEIPSVGGGVKHIRCNFELPPLRKARAHVRDGRAKAYNALESAEPGPRIQPHFGQVG